MTIRYFPFDTGAGSAVTEAQWSKMGQAWLSTGVVAGELENLRVYADGSGMNVKIRPGRAWIKGHLLESDAEVILPVAASHPSLNRWDIVVAEVDWINSTMGLVVVTGTPASSPSYPPLTTSTTKWQIPLGYIYVAAGATSVSGGNIADARNFCNLIAIPVVIGDGTTAIQPGIKGYLPLRMNGAFFCWDLVADVSGSIVIDVWKSPYSSYPPTSANSITGSNKPSLSNQTKNQVLPGGITGWATDFSQEDVFAFNVVSASSVKQVTFTLYVYKR